ncbi:phytoene desaturase family protein [Nocardiopsis sp. NRRL B-16309]|uniref:phytoene desaturase family protein n=1 Tax=Nocardiopsis sp. NRRL B-16309 TaxID=1519494 RepID=UPI0006B02B95|nr:phytoene desaturase family protein [Nocardiopsis sp. NRRL B-16309]KOX22104.1 phytoene dehydrogenase [Nocardiopsis sp. NRRL B-16309]
MPIHRSRGARDGRRPGGPRGRDPVVVVGAGLSGLACVLHLLGAGREVVVVEREDHPGGRAGRLDLDGFRIDTGPTVLTMPDLLDEAFGAVGESVHERLDLVPLAPAYRAAFADGSTIDVHTDRARMAAEVARVAGLREAVGYLRLREWLTRLYRVQMRSFIDAQFDSPLDLLRPDLVRLAALGGFGRLDPAVGRHVRDERLRRIFSFQSLYVGVPPDRALAAYAVIAYMDTVAGVHFPRGGMRAVGDALAAAAAKAGGVLRYGESVTRLERRGDRVTAVVTDQGERLPCDQVVLTTDLPAAHRLLGHRARRPVPHRFSPSAVVLHLGTDRTWGSLAHHSILFGRAWKRTFDEVIDEGRPMSDPSLLVTQPTVTDPTLAPEGRHLLYVLAPAPNLAAGRIDWDAEGPRYRDRLVATLEERGLNGLDASIRTERLVTPADWARQGLAYGTPFSLAHTFAQTGPFRPGNTVPGTSNAVLAGCGTTPGVGVPTVLVSGKLAAARVLSRTGGVR